MGKPTSEPVRDGRRQKLNVIYFVDSSRTRSLTIPIGRLNALLFLVLGMLTWSVVSVGLLAWTLQGNQDLRRRLRDSLATVFEFESRYENAFSVAYPSDQKVADAPPPSAAALYAAPKAAAPAAAAAPEAKPVAATPAVAAAEAAAPAEGTDEGDAEEAAAAKETGKETGNTAAATNPVVVGNPVLEKGVAALELHFDLTNKSESDKAEGYIWAVAEFVTTDGQHMFIGAPSEVGATAAGEPAYPQRSAIFSIRRYKKKSFSFPYVKDKAGTFTAVRIGVMDRSGGGRMTYNVPVEVQVGAAGAAKPAAGPDAQPKPG
jgi:hypothetical protein